MKARLRLNIYKLHTGTLRYADNTQPRPQLIQMKARLRLNIYKLHTGTLRYAGHLCGRGEEIDDPGKGCKNGQGFIGYPKGRNVERALGFSLTGTVSTSPNLAKEGVRSATIITRPSSSRTPKHPNMWSYHSIANGQ